MWLLCGGGLTLRRLAALLRINQMVQPLCSLRFSVKYASCADFGSSKYPICTLLFPTVILARHLRLALWKSTPKNPEVFAIPVDLLFSLFVDDVTSLKFDILLSDLLPFMWSISPTGADPVQSSHTIL